jgi:hypothetical protein
MKGLWKILIAAMLLASGLALSRGLWFPEERMKQWHQTWLGIDPDTMTPRGSILEDHEARLERIEAEYRDKIDREEKLQQVLQMEYDRLAKKES